MWESFAMQKILTFFQQKITVYLYYLRFEILTKRLTNDVINFEQLAPDQRLQEEQIHHDNMSV